MLILEQNTDDKLELIRDAIQNKYAIGFWYKGKDYDKRKRMGEKVKNNIRFAEPVALGRSKGPEGGWMLRAWQYGGTTNMSKPKTGGKPAWKTFLVDEMKSIVVYDGESGGYRAFDKPAGFGLNTKGDGSMRSIDTIINLNEPKGGRRGELDPRIPTKVKTNESSGFFKWLNYG